MRSLSRDRLDLIDALVAESSLGGITASLLEKDEHLTDALRALFAMKVEGLQLVFCGGTSLSKAHGLIERMSEDADIKVVLTEEAKQWSKTQTRRQLSKLRALCSSTLSDIGLVEDHEQALSFNDNRYIHSQWSYERGYPGVVGLRSNLQIELTVRAPLLATQQCSLTSLADRLAQRSADGFFVTTVSVAETQAEKVLSFLRRFAQHRAGLMNRPWDTALVRHIHDVHCIHSSQPELLDAAVSAFALLVEGDRQEFGVQHAAFAEDAPAVLRHALTQAKADAQTRDEYERNLLPLVYGESKPVFDLAFASFETVARRLLSTLVSV
ncbi:MAG: hypothetical protein JWP52_2960 [Rhizobacter sp.]|nr:hypothetical protein [Rhizobacter sp.]